MERENGVFLHLAPGEIEELTHDLIRAARIAEQSQDPLAINTRNVLLGWTVRLDEALATREEWDRELEGGYPVGTVRTEGRPAVRAEEIAE